MQDALNSDGRFDPLVGSVVRNGKVFDSVTVDRVRTSEQFQLRERVRLSPQLLLRLVKVIQVQMRVAAKPNQLSSIHFALLRDHGEQCGLLADIERRP